MGGQADPDEVWGGGSLRHGHSGPESGGGSDSLNLFPVWVNKGCCCGCGCGCGIGGGRWYWC